MPSLSGLLKRSKKAPENIPNDAAAPGRSTMQDSDTSEKIQRRQSKREFFRSLITRSNTRSGPRAANRGSQLQSPTVPVTSQTSPVKPTSPTSDPNKPLPPPPAPGSEDEEPVRSIPIKMNRIMSPLTVSDIHKLFSGAPQFFCRSEGPYSGAPWPSVAFPWNVELEIRDLGDHGQIEDQAWGCITASQHITRDIKRNAEAAKEHVKRRKGHFRPRCFERPNMVSYQGLERGTMGYSAALQIGVADALKEEDSVDSQDSLAGRRHNFLNDKHSGLRMLDELDVATRLAELGELYNEDTAINLKTNVELYSELFTKVLFPPTRVTDPEDPYSLHVQIEALLNVLSVEHIWIDFSIVEWRIRLGQVLWGPTYQPEVDDDISINGELLVQEPGQQRYWLLLQVLLSCELLIRLDILTRNAERNPKIISAEEIQKFDKEATVSVRWSMILARRWLENIKVELPPIPTSPEAKPAAGWLESLTGLAQGKETAAPNEDVKSITFTGQHQARQFKGLMHFAQKLDWPRIDIIAGNVSQGLLGDDKTANNRLSTGDVSTGNKLKHADNAGTPTASTPLSMTTQRSSSYFGNSAKRPGLRRGLSKQSQMSATIHPSGWLSQSYLTGLILPGEGLSHFLVSTLLENDSAAVATLGDEANLYGGFLYSGKSFWSTSCVIGRVLAAGKGASECMGWLSTDILPKGVKDGWVNVDVEVAPQDVDNTPATARIWKKSHVEKESHVLGNAHADPSSLLPGDFTLPIADAPSTAPLVVNLLSLDLFTTVSSSSSSTPETDDPPQPTPSTQPHAPIRTYSANMRFRVSGSGLETAFSKLDRELDLDLKYDVHFVTAHPCVPSKSTEILNSPTSPSFKDQSQSPTSSPTTSEGPHERFCGHPLHKSYHFTRHHLSTLLLPSSAFNPLASLHTDSNEVFVIDCTEPVPPTTIFSTAPTSPTSPQNPTHSPIPRSPALPPHITNLTLKSTASPSASTTSLVSTIGGGTGLASQLGNLHVGRKKKFGSDLEMLARAWCAEKGFNALLSRKGRNCIACSIREARALGWKIVLRFG